MHTGNRRRYPRIYRPVEVYYYFGSDSYTESTMSLSMGGLYVKTDRPLQVGSLFRLNFSLPDFDHLFKVRGQVIWKKEVPDTYGPPGMGIKFYDVAEEDKRAIVQYLANSQLTRQEI